MEQQRVPQYLHLPIQVLWFDANEIALIVMFYLAAMMFGGVFWIALFFGPAVLIPIKRRQARGFFSHLMLAFGFKKLKGYPLPTSNWFAE